MTPQAARALVERYFALMGAGGDLREVLAPDIVWHLPRTNPMGTPIRGLDAVLVMLGRGVDLYDPANMRFEVHRLIADEGAVAVRMTFHTTTAAGKPYDGEYQLQFACQAGRIREVWESPDSLYQDRMGVFADYEA